MLLWSVKILCRLDSYDKACFCGLTNVSKDAKVKLFTFSNTDYHCLIVLLSAVNCLMLNATDKLYIYFTDKL